MNKALIIAGLLLLLIAGLAKAETELMQPKQGETIEKTIMETQNTEITITVQNNGTTVAQITPETDANASFSPPSFGIDAGSKKNTTMTVYATPGEYTVQAGDQNFNLKVTTVENTNILTQIAQKLEKQGILLVYAWLGALTLVVLFALRRAV